MVDIFVDSYRDSDKGFAFCRQAQRYFETSGVKTKVLAASLMSIEEVMQLVGVHHITISPPLLAELAASTDQHLKTESSFDAELNFAPESVPRDEAGWRLAFTRHSAGKSENKLIQAINIFADMQDQLEDMVRSFRARA
jgi:transaldolase